MIQFEADPVRFVFSREDRLADSTRASPEATARASASPAHRVVVFAATRGGRRLSGQVRLAIIFFEVSILIT